VIPDDDRDSPELLGNIFRRALPALLVALLAPGPGAHAQSETRLTLQQALEMSRSQSPNALLALHRYRGSY